MPVTYQELAGSPEETYSREKGFTATRKFLADWSQRAAAVKEILGDGYTYGGSGPWAYPNQPGIVAARVRVSPFTDDIQSVTLSDPESDINAYDNYALIVVNYEPGELEQNLPNEDPNDEIEPEVGYLTYRQTYAGANRVIPGHAIRWKSDSEPPADANFAHFHRMTDIVHHLTWHRVPEPPLAAIRALINFVNDAEFWGMPAGTVLFDGATIEREYLLSEFFDRPKQFFVVTYNFVERRIFDGAGAFIGGWQYEYRSDPGNEGWNEIVDADGKNLYPAGDLMKLFSIHPNLAT